MDNEYFRLRAKALVCLLKKFGKRNIENQTLKQRDLELKDSYLYVTFTIRKKHKKGLFQYLKYLRKNDPEALNKPYPVLLAEWRVWRETELGFKVKEEKRTKSVKLTDRYAKHIVAYKDYMQREYEDVVFLFPSGHSVFGDAYTVHVDKHLTGRHLLNIVKQLNRRAWLHLFRETKGAEISRDLGHTITAVTQVRDMLDLEKETTAWNYVRRYAVQEVKAET